MGFEELEEAGANALADSVALGLADRPHYPELGGELGRQLDGLQPARLDDLSGSVLDERVGLAPGGPRWPHPELEQRRLRVGSEERRVGKECRSRWAAYE